MEIVVAIIGAICLVQLMFPLGKYIKYFMHTVGVGIALTILALLVSKVIQGILVVYGVPLNISVLTPQIIEYISLGLAGLLSYLGFKIATTIQMSSLMAKNLASKSKVTKEMEELLNEAREERKGNEHPK